MSSIQHIAIHRRYPIVGTLYPLSSDPIVGSLTPQFRVAPIQVVKSTRVLGISFALYYAYRSITQTLFQAQHLAHQPYPRRKKEAS